MGRYRPGEVALERALSKLGIASRAAARRAIAEGRVSVGGAIVRDPLAAVVPESGGIALDGRQAALPPFRFLAFHKPRGTVVTRRDPEGRPTIFDRLGEAAEGLVAVGRLDLATSGLLLLTSDTRLADWLTDPAHAIRRVYAVTVRGRVDETALAALRSGRVDRGELLRPEEVNLDQASGRESQLTVVLTEGRNREVRRLLASVGHEVSRLIRVAFGGLELGNLPVGGVCELRLPEVARAFPGAPVRELQAQEREYSLLGRRSPNGGPP
ncbi:MAG: pseudouridine synthase [Thermoanaerobaculia bacterium]